MLRYQINSTIVLVNWLQVLDLINYVFVDWVPAINLYSREIPCFVKEGVIGFVGVCGYMVVGFFF